MYYLYLTYCTVLLFRSVFTSWNKYACEATLTYKTHIRPVGKINENTNLHTSLDKTNLV